MIASMTGYGRGEARARGICVTVELRSVNSRFLDVATRLPRSLSLRENDIKEIIRKRTVRGKVNVTVAVEWEESVEIPLRINVAAARSYHKLLNQLRKAVGSKEKVKLEHLLQFSEVLEQQEMENTDDKEWELLQAALAKALDQLVEMRLNEGRELGKDFEARIAVLEKKLGAIEGLSKDQVPRERERLLERIHQLMENGTVDDGRLEQEVAILSDRLDVTEECVRFRSHNKFFLEALENDEAAGRKLNFLVQEMNREANTIGSKSSSSEIAHLVVAVKEELEKIREQLQNVE